MKRYHPWILGGAFSNPTVPQFPDCQPLSVGLGCISATFHCPNGCKGSEILFLDWLPNGFSIFCRLAPRHCPSLSLCDHLRDDVRLSATRGLYRTLLRSFSYPNESCAVAFRYTFSGLQLPVFGLHWSGCEVGW